MGKRCLMFSKRVLIILIFISLFVTACSSPQGLVVSNTLPCRNANFEYDNCPPGALTCQARREYCESLMELRCPADKCIISNIETGCNNVLYCTNAQTGQTYSGTYSNPAGINGKCKFDCAPKPIDMNLYPGS